MLSFGCNVLTRFSVFQYPSYSGFVAMLNQICLIFVFNIFLFLIIFIIGFGKRTFNPF